MDKFDYPKILLVGNFSWYSANGITVHNIFGKWTKGKLAILSTNTDDITKLYSDRIVNYYMMGKSEIIVRTPYIYFFKSSNSNAIKIENIDDFTKQFNLTEKKNECNNYINKNRLFISLRYKLIKLLGLRISLKKKMLSPELKDWIYEISPDYFYCTSSNIDDIDLAIRLKREFPKIRLIFHTFDDFVHSVYQETLLQWYWKRKLITKFKHLLEFSDFNLVISQKMASEYEKKFNKSFYPFHNPVDLNLWKTNTVSKANKNIFTFLYTGKVDENTAQAIKAFYFAINNKNLKDISIELKIYSPYDIKVITNYLGDVANKLSIEKFEYKDLPEKMATADAMLLALNNSKQTVKYIRLSMLTKATEYMAIKKPIFLFTPKNIAISEYLTEHNAAYFLDSNSSIKEISMAIKEFVANKALKQRLADNAYNLCLSKHTTEAITQNLLMLMNSSTK
jgi:glycosyltransferase involved in cell wall biosynthesis